MKPCQCPTLTFRPPIWARQLFEAEARRTGSTLNKVMADLLARYHNHTPTETPAEPWNESQKR